jgi:hypothetical protein
MSLLVLVGSVPSSVLADQAETHLDVEVRAGAGVLCAWCVYDREYPDVVKPTAQLFLDLLFPVSSLGPLHFGMGPYLKGALLDGVDEPQIGGGLATSSRWGPWELIGSFGFAYATERIGEVPGIRAGQTKHTYDLGAALRYHLDDIFVSVGYQHNSNAEYLGLNLLEGKGNNPGYDQVFVGIGIRF